MTYPSHLPEARAASWRAYRLTKLPYVERPCVVCGAPFNPRGAQRRCDPCRHRRCQTCGNEFKLKHSTQRFCSQSCNASQPATVARINKQRGKKPRTRYREERTKRDSVEDREWRSAVFTRDDYTCQICEIRGGRLQADHIEPYSLRPDLRLDIGNGRTLCEACHRQTPTYGWRAYWLKRSGDEVAAKRLAQEVLAFG